MPNKKPYVIVYTSYDEFGDSMDRFERMVEGEMREGYEPPKDGEG